MFATQGKVYNANMKITPLLFEALLKCPTKCWLRFTCEPPTGNTYAEWVQAEAESYRTDAAKRLLANAPADECAASDSSRRAEAHSIFPRRNPGRELTARPGR